jgi:hypothetical protein
VAITGWRLAGAAGLILGLVAGLGARSGLPTEPPATSVLNITVRGSKRKPPVTFSHRIHEAHRVACTRCHHDYQGRRNLWREGLPVEKCGACHGLRPTARRLDLKNAYHQQCKGCHLKLKQEGRRSGPIKCQECHRAG